MADDITCRLNNSSVTRVYSAFLPAPTVYILKLTLSIKILTFEKLSDIISKRFLLEVNYIYFKGRESIPDPLFLRLFDGISENLACPFDAFLICVGVHPQGDGFVRMPQLLRHAGNIGAVCYCHASEAMAEFMGV